MPDGVRRLDARGEADPDHSFWSAGRLSNRALSLCRIAAHKADLPIHNHLRRVDAIALESPGVGGRAGRVRTSAAHKERRRRLP